MSDVSFCKWARVTFSEIFSFITRMLRIDESNYYIYTGGLIRKVYCADLDMICMNEYLPILMDP
jgi:hypothetical protein